VRRIPRKDANHGEIYRALRDCGITVWDCASYGSGFPDIMLSYRGKLMLVEVKDGSKPPSARKLTDDEMKFHALFIGHCYVVETVDDALKLVGVK
jgi:hypothetical protein